MLPGELQHSWRQVNSGDSAIERPKFHIFSSANTDF
jgi:hypothetical protein